MLHRNCQEHIKALQIYVENVNDKRRHFIMFRDHVKELENSRTKSSWFKYTNISNFKIKRF